MLPNKELRTKNEEHRASFFALRFSFFVLRSSFFILTVSCASAARDAPPDVVAMERAALDRWGKGHPQGYLDIMATDVTYSDPVQEKRLDGLEAMKKMLAPIIAKMSVDRFDMIRLRELGGGVCPHAHTPITQSKITNHQSTTNQ